VSTLEPTKIVTDLNCLQSNPDDEEDILSKNSRELQIKRQTSTETHVSKIQIHQPQPGPSGNTESKEQGEDVKKDPKKWESFDDDEEDVKYAKLNEWEAFDEDDDENQNTPKRSGWERFDNDDPPSPRIINNLSLADETKNSETVTSLHRFSRQQQQHLFVRRRNRDGAHKFERLHAQQP
jgi:hypothetical protein